MAPRRNGSAGLVGSSGTRYVRCVESLRVRLVTGLEAGLEVPPTSRSDGIIPSEKKLGYPIRAWASRGC